MDSDSSYVKLSDICDSIDYGYTASANPTAVGPRFLRITDIVGGSPDWHDVPFCAIDERLLDRFRLHHGDIVIARTGATTGVSAYVSHPPNAVFASYLIRLTVSDRADARFVSYFLKSPWYWDYIRGVLGDKSAQPNANAKTLTAASLRLPLLPEQRAIAGILGALDDKIELNRRMNATLEALARALFTSWFVDFDPVCAKAEGRQPERIDAATAALFPDGFGESVIGPIPRGWTIATASAVLSISREGLNPGDWPDEIFDHYSIPAYDDERLPKAEAGAAIKSTKYSVCPDSVLISKLNPHIPRAWLPSVSEQYRSVCSTEFLVARPIAPASRQYLYGLVSSQSFLDVFGTLVTGTSGSHQRVQPESMLNMNVLVPSDEVIERFTVITKLIHKLVSQNLHESRTLATIRDALLPKLLSGEVRVREAEQVFAQEVTL